MSRYQEEERRRQALNNYLDNTSDSRYLRQYTIAAPIPDSYHSEVRGYRDVPFSNQVPTNEISFPTLTTASACTSVAIAPPRDPFPMSQKDAKTNALENAASRGKDDGLPQQNLRGSSESPVPDQLIYKAAADQNSQNKAPSDDKRIDNLSIARHLFDAEGDVNAVDNNYQSSQDMGRLPEALQSSMATNKSISAPVNDAGRTMSLSGSGLNRESQRSSSARQHKCLYCSMNFTRRHNFKSHLLTHNHEKPYYCETCEARFHRLHDLKRHFISHVNERLHVCSKCDRHFGSTDALARHNKGQGKCVDKVSGMSFEDEESHERSDALSQEDSMHDLMYIDQTHTSSKA